MSVRAHHLHLCAGETLAEICCSSGMQFDRDDPSTRIHESLCDRAGAGADVEDQVTGTDVRERDKARRPTVIELMPLPAAGTPGMPGHGTPSPLPSPPVWPSASSSGTRITSHVDPSAQTVVCMARWTTTRKMIFAGVAAAVTLASAVVGLQAGAAATRWTASRCLAANPTPQRYRSVPDLVQSWMGQRHRVVRNHRLFALPPGTHDSYQPDGDGGIGLKYPWYRLPMNRPNGYRSGTLTVTGHRLDGPGVFSAEVPSGYPAGFQPTLLHFSTSGCWRVDGRLGRSHLRLHLYVPRAVVTAASGQRYQVELVQQPTSLSRSSCSSA
jgi:hypothetical protein